MNRLLQIMDGERSGIAVAAGMPRSLMGEFPVSTWSPAKLGAVDDAYIERLTRAFRHALDNARRAGDLNPTVDLEELSAFLTVSLIGVAAMIRAEASPALVQAAGTVAASLLDGQAAAKR